MIEVLELETEDLKDSKLFTPEAQEARERFLTRGKYGVTAEDYPLIGASIENADILTTPENYGKTLAEIYSPEQLLDSVLNDFRQLTKLGKVAPFNVVQDAIQRFSINVRFLIAEGKLPADFSPRKYKSQPKAA